MKKEINKSMKIKMKYLFLSLFLSSVWCVSCNKEEHETPEENYEELFPFEGIDKPENVYGDIVVKPCNPDAKPEEYSYPGITDLKEKDQYTITLKYRFTEQTDSKHKDQIQSKYVIKYIDKNKKEVMICTDKKFKLDNSTAAPDVKVSYTIENHKWHTETFTVYSGHPLMLCVNGTGPRDSSIEAVITAVSKTGLTPELMLETRQYQNKEGIDRLTQPYCNYIVLP